MAQLLRSRARKPLAEGFVSAAWSGGTDGETVVLYIRAPDADTPNSRSTFYELTMSRAEAIDKAAMIANYLTKTRSPTWEDSQRDNRRTQAECLRALADVLDKSA